MTKAEKAEMEALRVRCALAWPPAPPKPIDLEVARAASGEKWLHLWWVNPAGRRVGKGITDGNLHSTTDYTDAQMENRYGGASRVSLSQKAGGPWYATEADALRALHYAVAKECAELLASIIARVEAPQ